MAPVYLRGAKYLINVFVPYVSGREDPRSFWRTGCAQAHGGGFSAQCKVSYQCCIIVSYVPGREDPRSFQRTGCARAHGAGLSVRCGAVH